MFATFFDRVLEKTSKQTAMTKKVERMGALGTFGVSYVCLLPFLTFKMLL